MLKQVETFYEISKSLKTVESRVDFCDLVEEVLLKVIWEKESSAIAQISAETIDRYTAFNSGIINNSAPQDCIPYINAHSAVQARIVQAYAVNGDQTLNFKFSIKFYESEDRYFCTIQSRNHLLIEAFEHIENIEKIVAEIPLQNAKIHHMTNLDKIYLEVIKNDKKLIEKKEVFVHGTSFVGDPKNDFVSVLSKVPSLKERTAYITEAELRGFKFNQLMEDWKVATTKSPSGLDRFIIADHVDTWLESAEVEAFRQELSVRLSSVLYPVLKVVDLVIPLKELSDLKTSA